MFLEETIESLEVENDSGLSNSEPGHGSRSLTNKMAHLNFISQAKPEGEYEGAHEHRFRCLQKCHEVSKKAFIIIANEDEGLFVSWIKFIIHSLNDLAYNGKAIKQNPRRMIQEVTGGGKN